MHLRLFALMPLFGLLAVAGCAPPPLTSDVYGEDETGDGDGDPGDGDGGPGDGDGGPGDGDGGPGDGDGDECGNGVVDPGEQCDLGPQNSATGQCTHLCLIAACGDGFVFEPIEECDDGNSSNTDACVQYCRAASCGDGFVQAGVEECDDGNPDPNDGCSNDCLVVDQQCGDGVVQAGEQCDDGNVITTDECPECQLAYCGDGFVWQGGEECDDGNNVSADGCDATCLTECEGEVLTGDWGGFAYYKVPVVGYMTDENIKQACEGCGFAVPCSGPPGCEYNDDLCVQTDNEDSCGNPMLSLGQLLCNASPPVCAELWGVYQYMGEQWSGGCGAEQNQWCVQGEDETDRFALCISP